MADSRSPNSDGISAALEEGTLVIRVPIRILPMIDRGMNLTEQEKRIFSMVLDAKQNKEIAAALNISVRTVKFHISSILCKTECETRGEVMFKFARPQTP